MLAVGQKVNSYSSQFKTLLKNKTKEVNVNTLGNTAHFIDEGVDTGKIIVQTAMCREDYEEYEDVLELQFPMLKMILRDFLFYPVSNQELVAELHHREKAWLMPSVTEK